MIDQLDHATIDLFETDKAAPTYKVYKNLHNGKMSILDKASGHVVGHANAVMMENVTFKVSEKGRQRVLAQKAKNVHAFMIGKVTNVQGFESFKGRAITLATARHENDELETAVTYNPFRYTTFVERMTEQPIHGATFAIVNSREGILAKH